MRRLLLVPTLLVLLALAGLLPVPASAMPDLGRDAPERVIRAPDALAVPRSYAGLAASAPRVRAIPLAAAEEPARGVWPLSPDPEVVRGFDPPEVVWSAGHRGVDLAGRVGQEVRAALGGTVSFAGRIAGRGVVVVTHGATRTTYEPVDAAVRRGDTVARGGVLGTLAWSAGHCLPAACLHWGLRRGDEYLDPLHLVGGGPQPVRLYPW